MHCNTDFCNVFNSAPGKYKEVREMQGKVQGIAHENKKRKRLAPGSAETPSTTTANGVNNINIRERNHSRCDRKQCSEKMKDRSTKRLQ